MFQGGQWRDLFFNFTSHVAGAVDSEKKFNPEITEIKVIVNGIPNKVYSRGMKTRDVWEEVFKRFEKENSEMNATDFYAGDRFGLFIYLRSIRDNNLHESGLRFEIGEYEGRSSARNQQECIKPREC